MERIIPGMITNMLLGVCVWVAMSINTQPLHVALKPVPTKASQRDECPPMVVKACDWQEHCICSVYT